MTTKTASPLTRYVKEFASSHRSRSVGAFRPKRMPRNLSCIRCLIAAIRALFRTHSSTADRQVQLLRYAADSNLFIVVDFGEPINEFPEEHQEVVQLLRHLDRRTSFAENANRDAAKRPRGPLIKPRSPHPSALRHWAPLRDGTPRKSQTDPSLYSPWSRNLTRSMANHGRWNPRP